jgi:hypothetical protein
MSGPGDTITRVDVDTIAGWPLDAPPMMSHLKPAPPPYRQKAAAPSGAPPLSPAEKTWAQMRESGRKDATYPWHPYGPRGP